MARRPALVLALILVLLGLSLVAAQPGKPSASPDHSRAAGSDAGNRSAPSEAKTERSPGRLDVQGGEAHGRYVNFTLDAAACRITDYRVYGVLFFESIQLPGEGCKLPRRASGAALTLRGNASEVRIHDAPTGLMQFSSEAEPVSLKVPATIDVEVAGNASELSAGNLTGRLFGLENASTAEPGSVMTNAGSFMVRPASGTSAERRQVFEAIQAGRVGASADVVAENGTVVGEVFRFDDVELSMRRGAPDRFDFTVAANLSTGRVFITNFDPGAWRPDRIRVDYNDVGPDGDHSPVRIRAADDLASVLNATGADAWSYAFEDEEGWHAAVYVPSFSVHMFQVVGLPLEVVPLLLYGIVIVGLVFGAGGVGILLERRVKAP